MGALEFVLAFEQWNIQLMCVGQMALIISIICCDLIKNENKAKIRHLSFLIIIPYESCKIFIHLICFHLFLDHRVSHAKIWGKPLYTIQCDVLQNSMQRRKQKKNNNCLYVTCISSKQITEDKYNGRQSLQSYDNYMKLSRST